VFVRAVARADGSTEVSVGGLARSDAAGGFENEFAELAELLRAEQAGTFSATPAPRDVPDNDAGEAETAGAGADRHEVALTGPDGE
jgi:hypothetical protein